MSETALSEQQRANLNAKQRAEKLPVPDIGIDLKIDRDWFTQTISMNFKSYRWNINSARRF
jgi:hypothetical protein